MRKTFQPIPSCPSYPSSTVHRICPFVEGFCILPLFCKSYSRKIWDNALESLGHSSVVITPEVTILSKPVCLCIQVILVTPHLVYSTDVFYHPGILGDHEVPASEVAVVRRIPPYYALGGLSLQWMLRATNFHQSCKFPQPNGKAGQQQYRMAQITANQPLQPIQNITSSKKLCI